MDIQKLTQAVMNRIFVEMEASGRHVHVTEAQAMTLFGHRLTPKRPLSQPGQYLAQERVTVIGPKGQMENVAVLGPERSDGQVEISLTDARSIGVVAPIRESGDIAGSGACTLKVGENTYELKEGVIAAQRHIHLTPADAEEFGVSDKQIVKVKLDTDRALIFDDVVVRVSPKFAAAMHIDTDESTAAGAKGEVYGEILK